MLQEITVQFPHSEDVWNKVVLDSDEDMYVSEEQNNTFNVCYRNADAFQKALERFEGMIEYKEL